MKPESFGKGPWEERLLEFDATKSLATGDSVTSISGITVWEESTDMSSTMISGVPILDGNKAYVRIIGGEDGHTYLVRVRLETLNGDKIEDDLKLVVQNIT